MEPILFVVAHPDDVAACMGGTALLLTDHYELHVVCATKGERGVGGWTLEQAAAVREAEEQAACDILGAELTFLGKIDQELFADPQTCRRVADVIQALNPLAVLTLWPIFDHPDHSAISEIARKAVRIAAQPVEFIYFEDVGPARGWYFRPDVYVDVSDVTERKLELIRCHACQNPGDAMVNTALDMAAFRGSQIGCRYAESFATLHARPDAAQGQQSILTTLTGSKLTP